MPNRTLYESGLCCMARHANTVPPWTCDCPCHAVTPKLLTGTEMTAMHEKLATAFTELAVVLTAHTRQLAAIGDTMQQIRREHPEWFDPTTGYLITDEEDL